MDLIPILRRHARAPTFALIGLLLVCAVVAINATAFGAMYAARWKALTYTDSERLIELGTDLSKVGFRLGLAERFRAARVTHAAHGGLAGGMPMQAPRSPETWSARPMTANPANASRTKEPSP